MRLSEKLRNEANHTHEFGATAALLIQAADLLDVYYIQCKAASVAESRWECRKNVKVALKEDV